MTTPNDSRRSRSRWALRGALAGLVAAAIAVLRCAPGIGLGGGGEGSEEQVAKETPEPVPAALRCQLRLDRGGLWLLTATGQTAATIEQALAACRTAGGADVVLTGEAKQGSWEELRSALEAAKVPAFVRGAAER